MAIYHYHRDIGKRADGKNAVFAVAYIRGEKRVCDKIEQTKDFSNKEDVVYKNTLLPADAPEWARLLRYQNVKDSQGIAHEDKTGEQFSNYAWNQIEFIENRCDSQLYYHDDLALPNDLKLKDAISLTEEFVQNELCQDGLFCDVAIHWDEGNHHIHVIFPTRPLSETGFDKKHRLTRQQLSNEVVRARAAWADYANRKMQECSIQQRIDHRSYQERGIDLTPTVKVGKFKHAEQEVIAQRKQNENRLIALDNAKRIIDNPHILTQKLTQEHVIFSGDLVREESKKIVSIVEYSYLNNQYKKDETQAIADNILNLLQDEFHILNEKQIKSIVLDKSKDNDLFDKLYQRVITHDDIMYLGLGDDGREHFVSRRAFEMESRIISNAASLSETSLSSCRYETAKTVSNDFGLNESQQRAIIHLTSNKDIALVCGYAGTGKTYLLNAAKKVWDEQHLKVIGLSTSGKATAGLEDETGIKSYTIAGFLKGVQSGKITIDSQTVLVMDEMGMTSMDDMDEVLKIARTQGAKFTGVGDIEQTQPVGRGASFRAMVEEVGAVYLDEIVRQKVDWQKEATYYFETNQTAKGLSLYEENGRIHFSSKDDEAQENLLSDWITSVSKQDDKSLDGLVIAAFTNEAVDTLNIRAREKLVEQGLLDRGVNIGGRHIAVGERLLFTKNDYEAGYRNGHFATVNEIKEDSLLVTLDNGKQINLSFKALKHYRYGYAATVHKLQGYTGNETFLMVDGRNWDRHKLLVGGSRHRYDLNIYASKDNFSHTQELTEVLSRHGLNDTLYDYPFSYASRRGYDIEQAANRAAGKLSRVKAKIYDGLSYLFNLQDAVEAETHKKSYQLSRKELEKRRKDAVIVAEFSDNRMEVAALLKSDAEANQDTVYRLRVENGQLAETILNNPSHFKLACERNRITTETLKQSLDFYQKADMVRRLAELYKNSESISYSDAYLLAESIKSFYPHICMVIKDANERNVFLNHITHESHVLRRDKAIEELGVEHRADINAVMRYIQLNYQINQLFDKSKVLPEDEKQTLFSLLQDREHQAYKVKNGEKTDELLQFFHLDKERVEQHASSYQDRLKVIEFERLQNTGFNGAGILKKQHLAHQFKADMGRFSKHIQAALKEGFKSVNLENWHYEQRLKKATASVEIKKSLKQVKDYKLAASSAYQAWQKAFSCQQKYSEGHKKRILIAQGFTYQRMRQAHQIMENLSSHLAVLSSQKVDTKRLAQDARVVEYIERYQRETKEPLKLHMAHYMMMNMKQYRAGLAYLGLEQEIYEKATHYHYLKTLKASQSSEHKQLVKMTYHYKKQAFDAAVIFKQFKYYQAKRIQSVSEFAIVSQAFFKRNQWASEIVSLMKQHPQLKENLEALKLDMKKINKQAASYHLAKNKKPARTLKNEKKTAIPAYQRTTTAIGAGKPIDYTLAEKVIKENYGLASVDLNDLMFDSSNKAIFLPLATDFSGKVDYTALPLDNISQSSQTISSGFYIANQPEQIKKVFVTQNLLDAKAIAVVEPEAMVVMASLDNLQTLSEQLEKASIRPEAVIIATDNHAEKEKREIALKAKSFSDKGAAVYLAKGRIKENASHVWIYEAFTRAEKIRGVESCVHSIKLDPAKTEKATLKSRFNKLLRQKRFDEKSLNDKTRPSSLKPLPYYMILSQPEKEAIVQYLTAHQYFKENNNLQSARERLYQAKAARDIISDKIKRLLLHPQYRFLNKELSSSEIKERIQGYGEISVSDFKAITTHINQVVIDKKTESTLEKYTQGLKERVSFEKLQKLFNQEQMQFIKEISLDKTLNAEEKSSGKFAKSSSSQKVQLIRTIERTLSSRAKEASLDSEQERGR